MNGTGDGRAVEFPAGLPAPIQVRSWPRPLAVAAVAVAMMVLAAGGLLAVSVAMPGRFDIHGQLTLKRLLAGSDGDGGCRGLRAFGDLDAGRPVTVFDGGGSLVATGALGRGVYTDGGCVFPIEVGGVPDGRGSYSIAVGDKRGRLTYSRDQAAGGVAITVGF